MLVNYCRAQHRINSQFVERLLSRSTLVTPVESGCDLIQKFTSTSDRFDQQATGGHSGAALPSLFCAQNIFL